MLLHGIWKKDTNRTYKNEFLDRCDCIIVFSLFSKKAMRNTRIWSHATMHVFQSNQRVPVHPCISVCVLAAWSKTNPTWRVVCFCRDVIYSPKKNLMSHKSHSCDDACCLLCYSIRINLWICVVAIGNVGNADVFKRGQHYQLEQQPQPTYKKFILTG